MTERRRVPFLDLVSPHRELRAELRSVFEALLDSAAFVGGPAVTAFEREFAEFCDASECVGVASGTDALLFALKAAGVREGDIAVTVPNTFIATAEAIVQAGARPEFVDIDERTYNMSPQLLREFCERQCRVNAAGELIHRKSRRRVTAVVPVHLYGQMADMDSIEALAEQYGLMLIEDACQAHGAEYFSKARGCWRKAGSIGKAAAFSFYPGKNLGACGEGGAVTTSDAALAQTIRMLRDHGQAQKYYHEIEGYNGRLDTVQAGILRLKLGHLAKWNGLRREAAKRYNELLGSTDTVMVPFEPEWSRAIFHLYVIRVRDRAQLQKRLAEDGIGTAIHYPVPLHLQKAYARLGYKAGDFPVTERCAEEVVSLPMFPGLSNEDVARVVVRVRDFVSKSYSGRLVAAAAGGGD